MRTHASRPFVVALVALLVVVGTALAVEWTVRAATRIAGACHPACITRYDSKLGWTNARLTTGRHRHPSLGFDVVYSIDAHGARSAPERGAARDGLPRVVVLGDSNGFGWGVDDDGHFAARLSLAGVADVLNLSVTGYGTDQALLRFATEGAAHRPHAVIVQATANDFDDIQASMVGSLAKPFYTRETNKLRVHNIPVRVQPGDSPRLGGAPLLPLAWREWLANNSWAYLWLNDRLLRANPTQSAPPRFSPTSVALFHALVDEIRRLAAEQGAAVILVHGSKDLRERRHEAVPAGVHVCDLSEQFAATDALFPDDLHWNNLGHRLAADCLAKWFANRASQEASTSR